MVNSKKQRTWELLTSRTIETVVILANSLISAIKKSDIPLGGLRIYDRGCIGVQGVQGEVVEDLWKLLSAPSVDIHLDKLLEKDYPQAMDKLALGIEFEPPKCEGNEAARGTFFEEPVDGPAPFETSDFIAKVELFLITVNRECPDFILSNKIKWVQREERIINTQGLRKSWSDGWLEVEVLFTHREELTIYSGSFEAKCHTFEPEVLADSLIQFLKAYEKPVELVDGRYPVVFFEDEYSFMQYFMVHLSGRNWMNGTSQLAEHFNGSSLLNVEFGRGRDNFISPFDACGSVLPGNAKLLISKGQVETPYLDRITAKQQGLKETASTWSAYDGVPGFGYMPLQLIDNRGYDLKEMLKIYGLHKAVLVFTTGGGEYGAEGNFTAPVQLAYLIEDGVVTGRLPQIAVSGVVKDMLGKDYLGVTHDSVLPAMGRRGVVLEMEVARL